MRATVLLFALAALLACGVCLAASNPAVGSWDCTATASTGQVVKASMTVKEDAGKLTGALTLESGVEIPLVGPKVEGATFTFKITINEAPYPFEIKINGARFSGKYTGPEASGTIEGTKKS